MSVTAEIKERIQKINTSLIKINAELEHILYGTETETEENSDESEATD